MMLQLVLVCCLVGLGLGDDTLYFVPHSQQAPVSKNFSCPDQTQCPVGNTCCQVSENSQFGCCPIKNGVCCSDGIHCCQKGTTCNPGGGGCIHNDGSHLPVYPIQMKSQTKGVGSVLCPDKEGMCPNGQTCCEGSDQEYACCPFDKASCCADKIHCCPEGMTCDLSAGGCVKKGQGHFLSLFKHPLTRTKPAHYEGKSVICPGGTSECPDGSTCCLLTSGQYGCCPVPKAVCCVDRTHCCPSGYKCDPSSGACSKDGVSVPWLKKTAALHKNEESVRCDATHYCPSGNTCCRLASGDWGCCPVPNAVCCADRTHCCPSGYTCQTGSGQCVRDGVSVPWIEKKAAIQKKVEDIDCDKSHECPDGDTCCMMADNQWGCCPMPKAVCCSDRAHCCPHGTTCDMPHGQCKEQDGMSVPWVTKRPAIKKKADKIETVQCDSTYTCPDGSTCCELPSGEWGYCPMLKAVCCSDGTHCCPEGTICNTAAGTCQRQDGFSVQWLKKTAAHHKNAEDVMCDAEHECPDGNTCCKLTTGEWGCCPIPQAVCCSDHLHCCPSGMTCDVTKGTCNNEGLSFTWMDKKPSLARKIQDKEKVASFPEARSNGITLKLDKVIGNVQCNTQGASCLDNQTCCPVAGGQFGCCPLPKGVCCSDHIHCCPQHSTCSVALQKCIVRDRVIDWFERRPAMMPEKPAHSLEQTVPGPTAVMCPDGRSECPDGSTCCKLASGDYGCCPLPDAVCCSDGIHCCPHGYVCNLTAMDCQNVNGGISMSLYLKHPAQAVCCSDGSHCCPHGTTCNVASGTCDSLDGSSVKWLEKTLVVNKKVEMVQCDATHGCPDGNTCCKLATGDWGCCPLLKAICCSDHSHCCPQGTTCDVTNGACKTEDGQTFTWLRKHPAIQKTDLGVFTCNGSQKKCNDGQTCCKTADGHIGCCDYTNGVCCSDGTHCCPSGTTCDVQSGHCVSGSMSTSWSLIQQEVDESTIPCGSSTCPDSDTCCHLSTGDFGCCPLSKAVCCSDGVHCCPNGTTCDTTAGTCNRQDGYSVAWLKKTSSLHKNVEAVKCDAQHECPDGNTCCKLATGEWGCCPMPQAVCCSDHTHCCPHGKTCNTASGTCDGQDGSSVQWLKKTAAIRRKVEDVTCDGDHKCPDGNTCCKLATGEWGCCPMPQAVCCSDHTHCCPHGKTCNTASGTCDGQDGSSVQWLKKTAAIRRKVEDVICDEKHECPDGNTCCKLATGEWGCCPMPQAVCCSDHTHCCPHGKTCNTASGTCDGQDGSSVQWLKKTAAIRRKVEDVICDGDHKCPDGNTCCKLATGEWGCCPMPQAACCSDGVHCCPHGTTCDVSQGKCSKQDGSSLPWQEKNFAVLRKNQPHPVKIVEDVVCPDQNTCPTGSTCCELTSGAYGCCPLGNAQCCADKVHCCPHGYTCDTASGTCSKGGLRIPFL